MTSKICYLFRSKKHNEFSIEKVFFQVSNNFDSFHEFMPFRSNLIGTIFNILYTIFLRFKYRNQKIIFHITGDIYYTMLILPARKTVITFHDCGILLNNKGFKRKIFYIFWYKLPLKKSLYITAISEIVFRQLCRIHTEAKFKTSIIPNPLSYV
jgi:hypothetical protein